MSTEYGSGFVGTVTRAAERREKIDTLGLDELVSTYLCSKYGKDPVKCIDCASREGCPAGKRVVDLLEEATGTKPSPVERPNNRQGKNMIDMARKRAEGASKADDAVVYMMETYGNTRDQAVLTISRYRKKFPDLTFNYVPIRKGAHKVKKKQEQESDEVSVSDFLNIHDVDTDGDKAFLNVVPPKPNDIVGHISNFRTALGAEYSRILNEIEDISSKITELSERKDRLARLVSSMEELIKVMEEER